MLVVGRLALVQQGHAAQQIDGALQLIVLRRVLAGVGGRTRGSRRRRRRGRRRRASGGRRGGGARGRLVVVGRRVVVAQRVGQIGLAAAAIGFPRHLLDLRLLD